MAVQQETIYVYHERQESALCAKHCLNNLLQGPYFTEFDLSALALALDEEENQLLAEDPDSLSPQKKESHNVGLDGNFSIQVIRRALNNLGLDLVDLGSEEATEASKHPENQEAFVCNYDAHWFAVRKIGGTWYDLNSLSGLPETPAKPTVVGDFYLSAYLATLRNDGYSIYVVTGEFPRMPADTSIGSKANWYARSDLKNRQETYPKELQQQINQSRAGRAVLRNNSTENELEKAIRESLKSSNQGGNNNMDVDMGMSGMGGMDDADADVAMALAMSMSEAGGNTNKSSNSSGSSGSNLNSNKNSNSTSSTINQSNTNNNNNNTNNTRINDDEEELKRAMLLSVQSEYDAKVPPEPDPSVNAKDICEVRLRLPNSSEILERKFLQENTIGDIFNFVKSKTTHQGSMEIRCGPGPWSKEENKKLRELDVGTKAIFTVKFV